MASFKNEQLRVEHRGRRFHFILYEAAAANAARKQAELPDTWYLVSSCNRWPAVPYRADQPGAELEAALVEWLEETVFGPPKAGGQDSAVA